MTLEASILFAIVLVMGNAFFVAAEFALVAVRRSAIEGRAAAGSRAAVMTLASLENLPLMLAGVQLGVTLCSLGLGAIGEPVVAQLLEGPIHQLNLPEHLLHPIAFAVALTIVSYLHVVFGEMIAKNLALANPERAALNLVPALARVVKILGPAVKALDAVANVTLRVLGISPKSEISSTYTRDELAGLVEESQREGLLSEDRESLLHGALRFDARTIETVALPMDQVTTVPRDVTPEQIEELTARHGYSRYPVTGRGPTPAGYVHLKDVLEVDKAARRKPISPRVIRPLIQLSHDQPLRSALKAMQNSGAHMALVVQGSQSPEVLGLVTLRDVLEEFIGER